MSLQSILNLSDAEKEELMISLDLLKFQMDNLVERFYFYFMKSDAGRLFEKTDMIKQHIMFNSSLGILIAHINHPLLLQQHLDNLVLRHGHYGVKADHINNFIESFKCALQDIFDKSNTKIYVEVWYKLIHSVMQYFKNQIK